MGPRAEPEDCEGLRDGAASYARAEEALRTVGATAPSPC
jgi:hypothetical protein